MKGNYLMLNWMYSKQCFSCKKLYLKFDKNVDEDESQLLNSINIIDLMGKLKELSFGTTRDSDSGFYSPRLVSIILNNSPRLESLIFINTTPVFQENDENTDLELFEILEYTSNINKLTCHFNPSKLSKWKTTKQARRMFTPKKYGNNYSVKCTSMGEDIKRLCSTYTNLTSLTLSQTNYGIYERDIIVLIEVNNALTNITIGKGITISDDLLVAITASCQQIKQIECCHYEKTQHWQIDMTNYGDDSFIALVQSCTQLHTINLHDNIIYTNDNDYISIKVFGFSINNIETIGKNGGIEINSLFGTKSLLKFISMINKDIILEIGNWNKNKLDKSEINDLCKLMRTIPTLRHLKLSIRNEDALQLLAFIPTNIKYLTILNVNPIIPTVTFDSEDKNDENGDNEKSEDKNNIPKCIKYKSISSIHYPTIDADGNVIKTRNDLLSDLLNEGLDTYTPIEFTGEELWFEEKVFNL
jgi:hypothetical protein